MTASPALPAALLDALASASVGRPLYVVGGFLRDGLLSRPSPDLDIAVEHDPAGVARRLGARLGGAPFPLGAEHGVYRVALREAAAGIGHIDVSALRGGIDDDLRRRDFTINAMAWQPGAASLIDPLGGAADLAARRLRLVSDAAVRADPLRSLRAVRFVAELGVSLDAATSAVIRRDAALLSRAAGERQRDELARILDTPVAAAMLRLADSLGLLDALIPELAAGKGCIQPKEHYYEVFDHNIETVAVLDCMLHPSQPDQSVWMERVRVLWSGMPDAEALQTRYNSEVAESRRHRALLKLAGLLHDVAKPQTRAVQADGRVRFFGHDDIGARMAAGILERLRYTSREIRLVELLIKDHLRPGQLSNGRAMPTRRALYRFFRDLGAAAPDLLLLNLADHAAARGPEMSAADWNGHVAYIHWILEQRSIDETLVQPARLLTGHDLMQELGLAPGPPLGRLLDEVREAQAIRLVTTREQALELARDLLAAGEFNRPIGPGRDEHDEGDVR